MNTAKQRIWDLPVRLFHWGLAASFAAAWLWRGDSRLYLHLLAGHVFLFLLLFRLYWGMAGSHYARFRNFVESPGNAWRYLKGVFSREAPRHPGHNPAGAWAVLLMLSLGLMIALTGELTLGGEEGHGPMAGWLDRAWGVRFHGVHEWLAWSMLGLVAVHLLGVFVESAVHRENLPLAMITGFKRKEEGAVPAPVPLHAPVAASLAAGLLLFSLWWMAGPVRETPDRPFLPFSGPPVAHDALWEEECGACHLAYHPLLLPRRSWRRLLAEQDDHFTEDLFLDGDTVSRLLDFALPHAAETGVTEAAWKIARSIPENLAPLRITETGYWREKHGKLRAAVWQRPEVGGRHNCAACHLDAEQAWFEDGAMRVPGNEGGMNIRF